mmetsp:Transcript_3917/g.10879  ORF Transcript_3917/g.10879 Transcript_3917/m.10879 type:complete len:357 (+) Transcript_3917:534-1604(+)
MQRHLLQSARALERAEAVKEAELPADADRHGWRDVAEPGVGQGLVRGEPLGGVALEQHSDQVLCVGRGLGPRRAREGDDAVPHLGQDVLLGFAGEGGPPAQESVHDDATRPQVAPPVVPPRKHLGCNILRRADDLPVQLRGPGDTGEAEVDQLQDVVLNGAGAMEEEVLGLEVAVCHVELVHVAHGAEDLSHDQGGLALGEAPGLHDPVEELPACAKLHHQMEAPRILIGLEKLDDVRMVHHRHQLDLLLQRLQVLDLLLLHCLDRTHRAGGPLDASADNAVGALAERAAAHVVPVMDATRGILGSDQMPTSGAGAASAERRLRAVRRGPAGLPQQDRRQRRRASPDDGRRRRPAR